MIKLNRTVSWLCLLAATLVMTSCGTTDSEPGEFTKTITAINGQTGEPLDGCKWTSTSNSSSDWIAENVSSITETKEAGEVVYYTVVKDVSDGSWHSDEGYKVTFDDSEPEEIIMKKSEY